MQITVTMPQMGESVVEGTIEHWLAREGERVEKDQTLCEVSTEKVDVEIPAPETGVLVRILAREGQTVEVGAEIAVLETAVERRVEAAQPRPPRAGEAPPLRAEEPRAPAQPSPPPAPEPLAEARRYSPLVRRMAAEHGVDLEGVAGSGPDGRVTREDLLAHLERERGRAERPGVPAEAPAARAAAPTAARGAAPAGPGPLLEFLSRMRVPVYAPREGDRVIPFSAVRRRIAEHMVVSKIVSPHVGTVAEVDLARLVRLRDRMKAEFERVHGFKLTYLPFVVQAAVRGLREFPRMNSSVVGETIVERSGIHVGVAVETDRGLVVPVIRDTDRLSLLGIAQAIEELARRARERKLSADDLQGGTFSVTNPGREGNLFGLAVIHQPQVGILRMGEVRKRPVVVEQGGEECLAIHPVMYLALSYDHRVIDGVTGNSFLYRVAGHLQAGDFEL
jgi:2-oxoglutarate dehydrogenase E2 component (dihydrolipoamide succinyltransferase)